MTRRRDEVDIMGEALGRLKIPPRKPKPADRPTEQSDRPNGESAGNAVAFSGGAGSQPAVKRAPDQVMEPAPAADRSAEPDFRPAQPGPHDLRPNDGRTRLLAEKLKNMRLSGMVEALEEQASEPGIDRLSFEERLDRLLTKEMHDRAARRLQLRIKRANLAYDAAIADVDFSLPREMDEKRFRALAGCDWIKAHRNLIINGPIGVGKSFVASALGRQACVKGYDVLYHNLATLLEDLAQARRKGSYTKTLENFAKFDLLILDNWGFSQFDDQQRLDVFGLIEFRGDVKSTLIVSQAPLSEWPQIIGDKKQAASIIDRLKANTHLLVIKGQSLRRRS